MSLVPYNPFTLKQNVYSVSSVVIIERQKSNFKKVFVREWTEDRCSYDCRSIRNSGRQYFRQNYIYIKFYNQSIDISWIDFPVDRCLFYQTLPPEYLNISAPSRSFSFKSSPFSLARADYLFFIHKVWIKSTGNTAVTWRYDNEFESCKLCGHDQRL